MLSELADRLDGAIHIHAAGQTAEVEDCVAATSARPIEWLARADFLMLDASDASLLGVPPSRTLDALVFSTRGDAIRDVAVGGNFVIRDRRHAAQEAIVRRFADAMRALWSVAG